MNAIPKPVRTTILYGLICAVLLVPIITILGGIVYRPLAFRVAMVLFASGYAVLLVRWANVRIHTILFPILIPGGLAFTGITTPVFLLFILVMLAWVRSGICFQSPPARAVGRELLVSAGGGLLVNAFSPHTPVAWAVGLWMFFLVQALYFPLFHKIEDAETDADQDTFETAKKQAEAILSDGIP